MFSRLRNLFSKPKTETVPEPEPEAAKNNNAYGNGGIDPTKLAKDLDYEKGGDSEGSKNILPDNARHSSTESLESSADHIAEVANEQQGKAKLSQFSQPNVGQSNGNIGHDLSTLTLDSKSNTTECTLDSNLNENKTGKSINTLENEKTAENDSATRVKEEVDAAATASKEAATDCGNGPPELVKVDKTKIEVSNVEGDIGEKQTEAARAVNEIEDTTKGENTLAAQNQNAIGQPNVLVNLVSLIAADNSNKVETPSNTSDTSPEHLMTNTTHKAVVGANKSVQISSSIAVDELATDASSPAGDTLTQSSSPNGTVTSESPSESNTIVIKPTGNNDIACTAISNKLQEIAEIAESLDASIRDVQQDAEALEVNATSNVDKKREAMRSNSSEGWHSRSTEDDSFVTASECNFTPHSHSSSYQTASGRTSSYISSDKNSFDVSEADDSTFASAYEISADINMSFDGSEQSFVSAQQQDSTPSLQQPQATHRQQQHREETQSADGAYALPPTADEGVVDGDGSSIADVEELHSQSVTPTPGDGDVEQYNFPSIPVESDSDLDSSCIVDAPSIEMLTEVMPVTSVTPEVSTCSSTEQQQAQNHNNTNTTNNNSSNNTNNQKPNAAWRRSKYYENITKQTIKGFL